MLHISYAIYKLEIIVYHKLGITKLAVGQVIFKAFGVSFLVLLTIADRPRNWSAGYLE
jgi:hypothetical protein